MNSVSTSMSLLVMNGFPITPVENWYTIFLTLDHISVMGECMA